MVWQALGEYQVAVFGDRDRVLGVGGARAAETAHTERIDNSALVTRTQARYEAVQALKAQDKGIKPIMRELGLAKETVRRFYRATNVEVLLAKRPSVLDEFKP